MVAPRSYGTGCLVMRRGARRGPAVPLPWDHGLALLCGPRRGLAVPLPGWSLSLVQTAARGVPQP